MIPYRNIPFTSLSSITRIVKNQLSDVGSLPAFVQLEAYVIQRFVDRELQPHRLFDLVADAVVAPVLKSVIGVELVDILNAILVNPDAEVVPRLVTHGRACVRADGKATGQEVAG